jgi:hypothetical protein
LNTVSTANYPARALNLVDRRCRNDSRIDEKESLSSATSTGQANCPNQESRIVSAQQLETSNIVEASFEKINLAA